MSATTQPASPDTTAPSVVISSPVSDATVSSTVTVSASASDNVRVTGLRFKLDGANLGAEDKRAPYRISWSTTGTTNGPHALSATARDAAGNTANAANTTVTVSNAASDTQAPSVPTGLSATAASTSQINLTWTASTDNVGVAGYRVYRGGAQIATSATTSYQNTGLTAGTAYAYTTWRISRS